MPNDVDMMIMLHEIRRQREQDAIRWQFEALRNAGTDGLLRRAMRSIRSGMMVRNTACEGCEPEPAGQPRTRPARECA